ncbi:MAG: redoxin domain-containing protein [Acidobacteriota bacterium]|nr:redoxin domain-containing protein [Acidobacteriota bacterium]
MAAIGLFAFESKIRAYIAGLDDYTIFDLNFYSLAGKKSRVLDGSRGYIVFYADMAGCQKCLNKIADLSELSNIYDDIAYYAILKGKKNKESFMTFLEEQDMPGEYYMDPSITLADTYGLSTHPALMFFNRKGKLMSVLPYDLDFDDLRKTYHRYIDEM